MEPDQIIFFLDKLKHVSVEEKKKEKEATINIGISLINDPDKVIEITITEQTIYSVEGSSLYIEETYEDEAGAVFLAFHLIDIDEISYMSDNY